MHMQWCLACHRHPEHYLRPRDQIFTMGYGIGLIVKSDEGRPIKVESNPRHSASLGATDVFAQASILDLYDPDRAKSVTNRGTISTWVLKPTSAVIR